MLGGYQILDLRAIDLTIGTSASNITDANVLKQLRELRNHIQKDYNFAKPLNNQLKPVLIRYRDKKNGEKHEVALYGNLEVLTNYYTFKINAIDHGEKLSIEVVFEEKTDEYENKYWDIKTAKVLLSIDETNPSVKPIYWHGLDLFKSGETSIQAHILNNTLNKIDTVDKLLAWAVSLNVGVVKLACCGSVRLTDGNYITHFIRFNVTDGVVTNITVYYCVLGASGGYSSTSYTVEQFKELIANVNDDVNKIN